MRIAILSQYYPPELGAPQNRLSDLARRLTDRGHTIEVLTALPNYPGNHVFPAYRTSSVVQEVLDGVPTKRLALYVPGRKTPAKRVAHYCSFALHAWLRGGGLLNEADYVITESPPLFLAPVGARLARRLKAQFVMNVSDLWPASAIELGALKPGLLARAAIRLEEWCYRQASVVTGQSEGIVEDISKRFPEKTVRLYPNGVDLELWKRTPTRAAARRALGWSEQSFIIGYVGLHGHAQALEQVLLTAQLVRDEPRIQFALFGDGPEKESLQERAKQLDLDNVLFYAPEPHERGPEYSDGDGCGHRSLGGPQGFRRGSAVEDLRNYGVVAAGPAHGARRGGASRERVRRRRRGSSRRPAGTGVRDPRSGGRPGAT